jgi:YD repeat-containing protein
VSYWTKNSTAYTISGTQTGYPVKGRTVNGWTYYEHRITGQSTISISGTGFIDEVRLYPGDAQMTTYTHSPLSGITSQTDPKGNISYFEYDTFGRLKLIKDQNGKILKQYDYQYQKPITQ